MAQTDRLAVSRGPGRLWKVKRGYMLRHWQSPVAPGRLFAHLPHQGIEWGTGACPGSDAGRGQSPRLGSGYFGCGPWPSYAIEPWCARRAQCARPHQADHSLENDSGMRNAECAMRSGRGQSLRQWLMMTLVPVIHNSALRIAHSRFVSNTRTYRNK